jgi:hypothetical protein
MSDMANNDLEKYAKALDKYVFFARDELDLIDRGIAPS